MTVSLGILVKKLNNDLQRYADREAKQLGLTQVQMSIIDFLARQGTKRPLYQTDVEHEFNIQKSSELIVRVPSKQDGRYKAIQLTEKSQKVAAYIRHFFDQNDAFLRNALGEDAEVVVNALEKLQTTMADKLADH